MTDRQKRGRNNKHRGYTTEKSLENFLNKCGIPAKRVVMSGELGKFSEDFRGDVQIQYNNKTIRIEVKSRQVLPRYITNVFKNHKTHQIEEKNEEEKIIKVNGLCYILDQNQFIEYLKTGVLPKKGATINKSECNVLCKWFKQDDCQVVAMKEFNKRKWYFAVQTEGNE